MTTTDQSTSLTMFQDIKSKESTLSMQISTTTLSLRLQEMAKGFFQKLILKDQGGDNVPDEAARPQERIAIRSPSHASKDFTQYPNSLNMSVLPCLHQIVSLSPRTKNSPPRKHKHPYNL